MRDRPGIEEGRHEREPIVLALEARARVVLPAIPDRADGDDHLPQPRPGRVPRDAEAALVVSLHLRAEAENEASLRLRLQIPRDLRMHERAARERDRDRRAEVDARRMLGGERERQVGVVAGLRGPEAVEPEILGSARQLGDVAERGRRQHRVELHARTSEHGGRSNARQ